MSVRGSAGAENARFCSSSFASRKASIGFVPASPFVEGGATELSGFNAHCSSACAEATSAKPTTQNKAVFVVRFTILPFVFGRTPYLELARRWIQSSDDLSYSNEQEAQAGGEWRLGRNTNGPLTGCAQDMLIEVDTLRKIRDGSVTLVFRRRRKPTVSSGGSLRTAVGMLRVVDRSFEDHRRRCQERRLRIESHATRRAASTGRGRVPDLSRLRR